MRSELEVDAGRRLIELGRARAAAVRVEIVRASDGRWTVDPLPADLAGRSWRARGEVDEDRDELLEAVAGRVANDEERARWLELDSEPTVEEIRERVLEELRNEARPTATEVREARVRERLGSSFVDGPDACQRCGGSGRWTTGGVCFRCGGSGRDPREVRS